MPPPQAAPQPVIPEDEFEQAVPPLDSELDRPLESIDAFEQEQSDGDPREEVAAPPTMVQGGDAGVAVSGNASARDPAWQARLPSLSHLDLAPITMREGEKRKEKD